MKKGAEAVAHDQAEYLEAIREHAPASTREIADAVGVTRQGADYRLRQLREDDVVESKMVGNSLVWMIAGETAADE
jgi:predicted ArsR family transcriptional regulator